MQVLKLGNFVKVLSAFEKDISGQLRLLDMQGKIHEKQDVKIINGTAIVNLKSSVSRGKYVIQFVTEKGAVSRRF